MALFKIKKGVKANLPTSYVEGYCYFTTDDGKFYIDTSNASDGRICLNAGMADRLKTTSAGSASLPVYFSNGVPVACNSTLNVNISGNAATASSIAWENITNKPGSRFVTYYNSNTEMSSTESVNTESYIHTVGASGGAVTTMTKPSSVDNAWGIIHLHLHTGNYAMQLGFGGTTGNMYQRHAYNSSSFGSWKTILDSSNYTSYAATTNHTHNLVLDSNNSANTTFAYSKAGLNYGDYTWLAAWNGYELRAVNKSQFAQASHTHDYAAASHTHDYLPLGGGTMSGTLNFTDNIGIKGLMAGGSDNWQLKGSGTDDAGVLQLIIADNATSDYFDIIFSDWSGSDIRAIRFGGSSINSYVPFYGAVWNDYAEFRICKEQFIPGQVVSENGDDTLSISTERLQRGCSIISDTFGFAIGETDEAKCPIAVTGRVLAYPFEPIEEFRNHIGYPVCSGPNGTVSIMAEEEEEKYPSRIIGTISAIPDYKTWGSGNVEVKNRVWIKVK